MIVAFSLGEEHPPVIRLQFGEGKVSKLLGASCTWNLRGNPAVRHFCAVVPKICPTMQAFLRSRVYSD